MRVCPYCGQGVALKNGLIVDHLFAGQMCRGVGQNPHNTEPDGRPLWSGKPNLWSYRATITEEVTG